jgi:DNA-binding transcriptional regulator YhcF (GntR family)
MGRGVFSDKASIILREAFKDVKKEWGVRELARSIGLDAGYISRVLKELENRNYISRKNRKFRINNADNILKDWAYEYDYRKNEEYKYYYLSKSPGEIIERIKRSSIPEKIKYAFGFHSGANLISPYAVYNEVHIYIEDKKSIKWFENNLALREVVEGANVSLLLPFNQNSVFYGMRKVEGLNVVSDIQLYLDLYKYPIRGIEQAEHIYEKRLKNYLEE